MRRILSILIGLFVSLGSLMAQYASINTDFKTIGAMEALYPQAFSMEGQTESALDQILMHYKKASLSSSGIFLSKFLDRKAMKNAGRLSDADKNYYFKRISLLVSKSIMPRIVTVASLCLKYPDRALYWGPYLYKTTEDVINLCMQFETVVTNGTLSFKDLVFFCISDEFKKYFDLLSLGEVDWKTLLDKFGDFTDQLSFNDLKKDIEDILLSSTKIGSGLASAGGDFFNSALDTVSTAGKKAFSFKLKEMKKAYKDFKGIYKDYSDGSKIKDEIISKLGSNDSLALTRLFKIDNYNTTRYLMQFWDELRGQYYKQRYYIYYKDEGDELLCSYMPPTSPDTEITKGREWLRFSTSNPNMVFTSSQLKSIQRNSENYAGWSEAQVKNLNNSSSKGKYNYEYYKTLYSSIIRRGDKVISKAGAYKITVRRWWNVVEEVYEEMFDSYNMDINAFLAKMNGKVEELNSNQSEQVNYNGHTINKDPANPIKYYLGCDEKLYYEETDANKLQGCESVEFVLECHESNDMGNATFSWKENGKHNHSDVRDDSRQYAMNSNAGDCSTNDLETEIDNTKKQLETVKNEISQVEATINDLEIKLGNASEDDSKAIQDQLNEAKSKRTSLLAEKKTLENKLSECNNSLQELTADCADELDGPYRIPNAMLEVERSFDIRWSDDGAWSGNNFIRKGTLKSMGDETKSEVVFTAALSVTRGEKRVFGIRVHRAILKVAWTLKANHTFSQVVEVMQLDPNANEQAQKNMVNARLRELQRENPNCVVKLNYNYQEEVEKDNEDTPHLLWASDRLDIARDIEYRLALINAGLIMNEKYLRQQLRLRDYLSKQIFGGLPDGSKQRFGGLAYRRWRSAARQVANGTDPKEIEIEKEN